MKLYLLLFSLFLPFLLIGQDKTALIQSLGHDNLSPAGQDTIYKYAQSHSKELWEPSWNLMRLQPIPEVKQNFRDFFADKLSAEDIALLDVHWDEKQRKHIEKTRADVPKFEAALACQKVTFDSLLLVHLPKLSTYKREIETTYTPYEISQLFSYYQKSLVKLRMKRDEFLDHAKRFTTPISPAAENYLSNGFAMMEQIPSIYYYNMVGHVEISFDFIDERPLAAYTSAYGRFMDDILYVLEDRNCRCTTAIPYYFHHLRENRDFLRRDALLFATIQFLEEPDEDAITVERAISRYFPEAKPAEQLVIVTDAPVDTMMENPLTILTTYGFADFSEAAKELGGTLMVEMGKGGPKRMVMAQLHFTDEKKQELLKQQNAKNWRLIPGMNTKIYFKDIGRKSGVGGDLTGVDFLLNYEGALLEGSLAGPNITDGDILDVLAKIGIQ